MAAPFRQVINGVRGRTSVHHLFANDRLVGFPMSRGTVSDTPSRTLNFFSNSSRFKPFTINANACSRSRWRFRVMSAVLGGTALSVAYVAGRSKSYFQSFRVYAGQEGRPKITPSRRIIRDTDNKGLKLTLYQFQTCPFCCKVRAVLDYYGFSYDVIEVNSVTKKQIKWLDYQKVPILVIEPSESKEEVVLKDSTVIISVLESYLHDQNTSIAKFNSFFPCIEEKDGRKTKYDFPNKYFIMFQEKSDLPSTPKQRSEERKWRKWADNHLVHMLSPNVYRSVKEALQAFNYFSEVGQWEENFSFLERKIIVFVGAAVMYIMGFVLKKRYELKDDVRQSLYDSCNEWLAALKNNKTPFMGGHDPNLADLAVYGVLNSIEGCLAFDDLLRNTNISNWYDHMKKVINENQGAHPLNSKPTPSDIPKNKKH